MTTPADFTRDARLVRDGLVRCRDASYRDGACTPSYETNLWKRLVVGRVHPVEQVVALLYDATDRHAPDWMVDSVLDRLRAVVEARRRQRDGLRSLQLSLIELHRAETRSQAEADIAQVELHHDPSLRALLDALDASDREAHALDAYRAALQAQLVTRSAA